MMHPGVVRHPKGGTSACILLPAGTKVVKGRTHGESDVLNNQRYFLYISTVEVRVQLRLTVCRSSADVEIDWLVMGEKRGIRQFGYQSPRYPFPKMVNVEVPQETGCRMIGTHGIDISVDGIAVAADVEFDPAERVTLAIPLPDGSVARIPSQVQCQTKDHCRFAFECASGEQQTQIEHLISGVMRVR